MKITNILFFCYCLFACGSNGQNSNINSSIVNNTAANKPLQDTSKLNDTISIAAVGDIMFGSNFPDNSKLPPNLGKDLMQPFATYLKNADVTFGNAEGVFLDAGGTPKGKGGNVFCFRQPIAMAQYFVDYGFDLISIANNHVADFGDVGLNSTHEVLSKLPFAFSGSIKQPTCVVTVRGKKIGMAAFAPHNGSIDMNNIPAAVATVKKLKQSCDIVIVSFHGGGEGAKNQHVTKKREIFFGQNRGNVYEFAHTMVDAGADVIIGHGPHVVRAAELYKNKFIAYSLGNFCTYGMFNLKDVSGNAPLLKLNINSNGNFINAQIISGKQFGEGGPVLDETERNAFNCIADLTQQDLGGGGLVFANGNINKK
jgi:poly-gamma-glutamate capsule biosynthesis protein CapA/YwtB (metallophosphatase superfamily)